MGQSSYWRIKLDRGKAVSDEHLVTLPCKTHFLMFITVLTAMGWGGVRGAKVQASNRVTVHASAERSRQSISKFFSSELQNLGPNRK